MSIKHFETVWDGIRINTEIERTPFYQPKPPHLINENFYDIELENLWGAMQLPCQFTIVIGKDTKAKSRIIAT